MAPVGAFVRGNVTTSSIAIETERRLVGTMSTKRMAMAEAIVRKLIATALANEDISERRRNELRLLLLLFLLTCYWQLIFTLFRHYMRGVRSLHNAVLYISCFVK